MSTRTKYGLGPDVPAARPSLSEAGKSPLLRVRISRELHASVRHAAEAAGTSRSEWVRQALEKATRRAG